MPIILHNNAILKLCTTLIYFSNITQIYTFSLQTFISISARKAKSIFMSKRMNHQYNLHNQFYT